MPAVHPHHLHQRPAAGRTRQRLPQSGRHVDRGGLTPARSRLQPAHTGESTIRSREFDWAACMGGIPHEKGRPSFMPCAALRPPSPRRNPATRWPNYGVCATSTRRVVATPLALRYRQSRSSISCWLRQIYGAPLPHVAALTVVRRCREAARRDVTALGVLRSATLLFSPRRVGNVKFGPMDLIYDAVVRTRTDDGRGHFGRALAACAPREPVAFGQRCCDLPRSARRNRTRPCGRPDRG